jgi:hypothetical protein
MSSDKFLDLSEPQVLQLWNRDTDSTYVLELQRHHGRMGVMYLAKYCHILKLVVLVSEG